MKLLLFLPLIILLTGCTPEPTAEQIKAAKDKELLDVSMEAFEYNESVLEDEVVLGTMCLRHVTNSGNIKSEECDAYHVVQKSAAEATELGVDLLISLFMQGYLSPESPRYEEFITIAERLVEKETVAKAIKKTIEERTGSGCKVCSM
jgi:hypothetical protein